MIAGPKAAEDETLQSFTVCQRVDVIEKITKQLNKKETANFGEGMAGFAVLCLFKPNRRKY